MRWNFEGVSVFAPFCVASHFLLRKAAAYFCWFCCRMCRNRQRGLNFGPIPCDWCPWAVASETLFYIKFHMYTLLYNFLFKSLSSSVWQRQTAVWLCGISRKRSDRRICSERIKSSQSLNSLCITVRQAEMFSLSEQTTWPESTSHNYMEHTIRMNYLLFLRRVWKSGGMKLPAAQG